MKSSHNNSPIIISIHLIFSLNRLKSSEIGLSGNIIISLRYALRFRNIFKYKTIAVWFWLIGVTSLVISTVYLRYHWVVDVLAGVILAIAAYYLTEVLYKSWHNLRLKHGLVTLNTPWQKIESSRE